MLIYSNRYIYNLLLNNSLTFEITIIKSLLREYLYSVCEKFTSSHTIRNEFTTRENDEHAGIIAALSSGWERYKSSWQWLKETLLWRNVGRTREPATKFIIPHLSKKCKKTKKNEGKKLVPLAVHLLYPYSFREHEERERERELCSSSYSM